MMSNEDDCDIVDVDSDRYSAGKEWRNHPDQMQVERSDDIVYTSRSNF